MPKPIKVLQPNYFGDFKCIGPACEDSCCQGMGVVLDKSTFQKYQACTDPALRPIFDRSLQVTVNSAHNSAYGFIRSVDRKCPFWADDGLCRIQTTLGEEALSRTCATYPRSIVTVDDIVERSLYLSCPEAARLVLLDPRPMSFVEIEEPEAYRFGDFPELSTAFDSSSKKPYHHAAAVRQFALQLLQNRSYALWERLVLLGSFCEQLDQICNSGEREQAPNLVASYNDGIAARSFAGALAAVSDSPVLHVNIVRKIVDARLESEPAGERILECYKDFERGICCAPDEDCDALGERYACVRDRYYKPFHDRHGFVLEQFVVYQAFRNLLPFGPQKGPYVESPTIYDAFVNLAVHYTTVRSLLVGMSGWYRDVMSPDQAVRLIQAYARDFEHNVPFIKRVASSLADIGLDSMRTLAILIKDPV